MPEKDPLQAILERLDTVIKLLSQNRTSIQPPEKCPLLYEYLDEWLNVIKAPQIKPKSLKVLRSAVDNYIKPVIPNKPLYKVRPPEMLKAIDNCPYSYMRQVVYNVFRAAFKRAFLYDLIAENPTDKMEFVKHYRKTGRALTQDEQAAFMEAIANEPSRPLWVFYLLSGCRSSEALTLLWSDIDYTQGRIYIRGTKTYYSKRFIPLFPQIGELLEALPKNGERVFPYTMRYVKWHFDRIRKAHGFTFRLHDLRHTFATRCLESGITMKTVSKWLGHSSEATTANIYTHVLTDFEREEAQRFNPKI